MKKNQRRGGSRSIRYQPPERKEEIINTPVTEIVPASVVVNTEVNFLDVGETPKVQAEEFMAKLVDKYKTAAESVEIDEGYWIPKTEEPKEEKVSKKKKKQNEDVS